MVDCTISAVHVYPVKGCRGVRVQRARVTTTGLEHDRAWCIVDLKGAVVPRCEAISQQRMPALAKVDVKLSDDGQMLSINAPGMPQLVVPTAVAAYNGPMIQVQSSGSNWWLGAQPCRQHTEGSAWFTEYLNRASSQCPGKRNSGSSRSALFALCRSVAPGGLAMASYPPILPLTERAASDPRFAGSAVHMADFAPFKLVNITSAEEIAKHGEIDSYPVESFRANLVVRTSKPWEEETWARLAVRAKRADGTATAAASRSAAAPVQLTLRKVLECPASTAHCRDACSGEPLFPRDPQLLLRVLKAAFPERIGRDAPWGMWATGATFGVYFSHGGAEGLTLSEGDQLVVVESCTRWGALALRRRQASGLLLALPRLGLVLAFEMFRLLYALVVAVVVGSRHRGHADVRARRDESERSTSYR